MLCLYYTTGSDIIFNASGSEFSLATGDRMCFNMTIVDDNEFEYRFEYFDFSFDAINNSLTSRPFFDQTRVRVTDNEGKLFPSKFDSHWLSVSICFFGPGHSTDYSSALSLVLWTSVYTNYLFL